MRRYTEFEWLLCELQVEEPFVIIPPIPPKHIGMQRLIAEDNAVLLARFKDLQFFLEYVVQHGRLSQTNCLERFLTFRKVTISGKIETLIDKETDEKFLHEKLRQVLHPDSKFVADLETTQGSYINSAIQKFENLLDLADTKVVSKAENGMRIIGSKMWHLASKVGLT